MITVMTICYIACVFVAFRVIKIKPTPRSIAIAVLVGVFMLGGIVIAWNQSAPMTSQMVLRRHVLQVVPDEREFVTKVLVKENQAVTKGEALFEIQPDRFQDAVDQANAQLAAANQTVLQLEAAVKSDEAAVQKSQADLAAAKAQLDTALAIQKENAGAIARLTTDEQRQAYRAAQADDALVKATLKQTQYSLAAARHAVDVAKAALNSAQFDLEQCTYTSPFDEGQVMNWQITEGTPTAIWRFAGIGTVQDLSDTAVLAIYPANLLKNVKPGNTVEIAFKRRPGQIATGKVEAVVKYSGEGQFLVDKKLPEAASVGSRNFLGVRIRLDDEQLAKQLPLGAAGSVAVYTDVLKPFHLISKITVRIKAWVNYAPI